MSGRPISLPLGLLVPGRRPGPVLPRDIAVTATVFAGLAVPVVVAVPVVLVVAVPVVLVVATPVVVAMAGAGMVLPGGTGIVGAGVAGPEGRFRPWIRVIQAGHLNLGW